jgi:hypothetical protein
MHEAHHAFDSTEYQLVVSISPPVSHHPSNSSNVFPLCSLHVSSTESKACYPSTENRFAVFISPPRAPSLQSLPRFPLCPLSASSTRSKAVLLPQNIILQFLFQLLFALSLSQLAFYRKLACHFISPPLAHHPLGVYPGFLFILSPHQVIDQRRFCFREKLAYCFYFNSPTPSAQCLSHSFPFFRLSAAAS